LSDAKKRQKIAVSLILSLACLPFHHSRNLIYQWFAIKSAERRVSTIHRPATYQKVFDARKRSIRGLCAQ
jgi:hypothetical protein